MTNVEKIKQEVRRLSEQELASVRAGFSEFGAASWDREFESDVVKGRLDGLADSGLADHAAGHSRTL